MPKTAHAFAVLSAVVLTAVVPKGAWAASMSQTQTMPLTSTDFSQNNAKVAGNDPLVFQQFNTHSGALTLDSVTLNFGAAIQNQFGMTFTTPSTITDTVANNAAPAGTITANTVSNATPGPQITVYQPDGKSALLTVAEPNDPSYLTRTITYGNSNQTLPQTFSSTLPTTSPFYIAPTNAKQSSSLTITSPAGLALFTGTHSFSLPISASAISTIKISSGNGSGSVTTQGTATATITYNYHSTIPAPETVPEPATVLLWGVGGLALVAARRARGRGV